MWPTTHVYDIQSPQLGNKCILLSPFASIERGAEAGPGGPKSADSGQKSAGIRR
jgi:hypothetical protein